MKYALPILCFLGFFVIAAVHADPLEPPTHARVFKDLYDLDSDGKAVKTEEKESVDIWAEKAIKHQALDLYVVFTRTEYDDMCMACGGGSFSIIIYQREGDHWAVFGKNRDVGSYGAGGYLPDVTALETLDLSPDHPALLIKVKHMRQGTETEHGFVLELQERAAWAILAEIDLNSNSDAWGCNTPERLTDPKSCETTDAKLFLEPRPGSKYPDLVIRSMTQTLRELPEEKIKVRLPKTVRHVFRGTKYVETCNEFRNFESADDGTMTDPRDGLIWQACPLGQTWKDGFCQGTPTKMAWWDAMTAARKSRFLKQSDWRLPTIAEYNAIVGNNGLCEGRREPGRAISEALASPVEDNGDYGTYWSLSADDSAPAMAHEADTSTGGISSTYRDQHYYVRLVRGENGEGAAAFQAEFAKIGQYRKTFEIAEKRRQAEEKKLAAEAAERAKQEKAETDRRAKQEVNDLIKSIIARCRGQMGRYGSAMVKSCVDQDLDAMVGLMPLIKAYPGMVARCQEQMGEYGYAMVKSCAEQDIEAEKALEKY